MVCKASLCMEPRRWLETQRMLKAYEVEESEAITSKQSPKKITPG